MIAEPVPLELCLSFLITITVGLDVWANQLPSCINTGLPGDYHPVVVRPGPLFPGVHSHFTIIA